MKQYLSIALQLVKTDWKNLLDNIAQIAVKWSARRLKLNITAILIGFLFLCSCEALQSPSNAKRDEVLGQGVYGANSAIQNGRIDVAAELSTQTAKLLTPPKHPLKISPVYSSDGEKVTVLPENLTGSTVRVNSKEFLALKASVKNYEAGEKNWKSYSVSVEKNLQDSAKEKETLQANLIKSQDKIKSLSHYRNLVWGVTGGFGLLILGVVVFYVLRIVLAVGKAAAV